jgi:PKD domain/NHL repeat
VLGDIGGIAVDQQGNIFLSCTPAGFQRRILAKVSPSGAITVIHKTATAFEEPDRLAVARKGDLYFVAGLNSIRLLTTGGAVKIVLSRNLNSILALATDRVGNLYYVHEGYPHIYKLSPGGRPTVVAGAGQPGSEGFSGDGGPAVKALLGFPNGLAVDANGDIYFEDGSNMRVRRIGNALPIPSLKATPPTGRAPLGVSLDASSSRDPDGSITSYAWDFGDRQTGTAKTTQHTYTSPGTYRVKLTVADDSGAVRAVTRSIVVTKK